MLPQPSATPWVAPFATFMVWLAIGPFLGLSQPLESILRVGSLLVVLLTVSRPVVFALRVKHWVPSILLGLTVGVLWVLPDLLFDGYRSHWLFQNSITGGVTISISRGDLGDPLVLTLRIVRAALLVPFLEELFWRGFLPRWIVDNNWDRVPMGTYSTLAFVGTALLFASEHGPFWDVGLLCGLAYNWYMWKTKSLGDLVLVHVTSNAALSAMVLITNRYSFWM